MRQRPVAHQERFRYLVAAIFFVVALLAIVVASPTAPRTASSAGQATFQPELPIAAAFFYPWYPSHWAAGGTFPITNYTPELGFYSSTDETVIREQLSMAEQAHLEAFISSWWGPGEESDLALQQILSVTEESASPMRWAAYYEPEGYGDPAASAIAQHLSHLAAVAFDSPAYLRVDDKPVLFVYDSGGGQCSLVDRWLEAEQQSGVDVYLVLKVLQGYSSCGSQPDAWHEYNPIAPAYDHSPHSVSISPGFWKFGSQPLFLLDLEFFELAVRWMVETNASWQLITTWNEWIEGTTIEPSLEYGWDYIDVLCRHLPGTTPCTIATPTPTPSTPSPTPTNVPAPSGFPSNGPSATPAPTVTPVDGQAPALHGDLDCDGDVDPVDALQLLGGIARGSPVQPPSCMADTAPLSGHVPGDVDCDGAVKPADGLMILRYVAGLPVEQGPACPAIAEVI